MSLDTEKRVKEIMHRVTDISAADECTARMTGSTKGNIRFALNSVSTTGIIKDARLQVSVAIGKRRGSASTNRFDDESLRSVVKSAEEIASLSPDDREFMPAVEKQKYIPGKTWVRETAAITPDQRARMAAEGIDRCSEKELIASGFLTDAERFQSIANSNGNYGFQKSTDLDFTCTVRTPDGSGSGWVGKNVADVRRIDTGSEVMTAIEKASLSRNPEPLEPGKYTVILEPAASAGLLMNMFSSFDARSADEGRSFLSGKGGGNRLGEKLFSGKVNISSDPRYEEAAVIPWDQDGLSRQKLDIVKNGVVKHLHYSRYWAGKQEKQALGKPGNMIIQGSAKSTLDLIRSTEKGILVTRTWYIRVVDPRNLLLTGLTRDGTFMIRDGEISHSVHNFRFNESPVEMLRNLEDLGKPKRIKSTWSDFIMMVPSMKVGDFTLSSVSDAV